MHIVVAPNSFKNSLDATSCAQAIKEGLLQSRLKCTCTCFPVGDGGDGTAALLIKKWKCNRIAATVHDPLMRSIPASFGFINKNKTAIIEMADASGIKLLKAEELNPLHATSFGTGELIKKALDKGAKKIILCIGGSATVDGGAGILHALGFRFLDSKKKELKDLPSYLIHLSMIDNANADKRIFDCEFVILCDVENFLLGENGAAKIFGPQKGADSKDVQTLEKALTQFRDISLKQTGVDMNAIKHGGAAGGVAAGLSVWLNAKPVKGIEYFLDATNFNDVLKNADLLITGEGSIDEQTLKGKAPYGVAKKAKQKQIPVIGLAGKIPMYKNSELNKWFDVLLSINNEPDINEAILHTKANLKRTAKSLGDLIVISKIKTSA
ncbi:MAG TPA: glycerate kinase [Parafilimonas sp.]|nr:glycerate kinase [Parafilimonas sp.]